MSKVLVSFLGTSNPEIKENYRQYRQAKYRFDNGESYESSFIAMALKEHYKIDRVILIGTPKSMWEEVYYAFSGNVDDVYAEIGSYCEKSNFETPLENFPHKAELEKAMGENSSVVLVHYGLNRDEISHNSELVLSIEKLLQSGDELYLDITHSFRSLPLLLMNSLLFMKSASVKNIAIRSISYGMLDITRELGYTPVVELNSILDLNDWIAGASELKTFGNAYKVAALMGRTGCAKDACVAKVLTDLSDAMNLNYISVIRKKLEDIKHIKFTEMSPFASFLVEPLIRQIIDKFKNAIFESQFQFCLAEYQFEQKHYAAAALGLAEAMVSLVAECTGLAVNSRDDRNSAKAVISCADVASRDKIEAYSSFCELYLFEKKKVEGDALCEQAKLIIKEYRKAYNHLKGIRNGVAHSVEKHVDFEEVKKRLLDAMQLVRPMVSYGKRGSLRRLFVLTNHVVASDQSEDAVQSLGVSALQDLPPDLKELWGSVPPELDSVAEYVRPVIDWLGASAKNSDVVWVQGEWGAVMTVVSWCAAHKIRAVYATTKRAATEVHSPEGVNVTHVFKHVRFRDFPI